MENTSYLYAGKLGNNSELLDIEKVFSAKFSKSIDGSYYLKVSESRIVFYYKFDVIVFFGFKQEEIQHYIELLKTPLKEKVIFQDYYISYDISKILEGKDFFITDDKLYLRSTNFEYLEVISLLLSHSVALENYEWEIDTLLGNTKFYKHDNKNIKEKEVLELGSKILSMKHEIISDLYLLDKPDIVWDDFQLEKFYESLYKFFDLSSRFSSLEYKLNIMTENVTFLHEILNYKKWHFLEWIIIYLILFEIVYTLVEHFII